MKLAIKGFSMKYFYCWKQKTNWLWHKYCKLRLFSGAFLYSASNEMETYLKVLLSDKLSGDGQIFQVWPYLNSFIIIKLHFSQQERLHNFSLFPCQVKRVLLLGFVLQRDLKNIFYYQHDAENCMKQVLDFFIIWQIWKSPLF